MKILVAFYSWQGHTETVARELAHILDSALVRIEPLNDPTPEMIVKMVRESPGSRAKIKPCLTDMDEIDHLVIATPVWSHTIPPYTREYLSQLRNCSGKKFSVLVEMGRIGAESTIAAVREILEGNGMTFVASASTIEDDVEAKQFHDTIEQFSTKILSG